MQVRSENKSKLVVSLIIATILIIVGSLSVLSPLITANGSSKGETFTAHLAAAPGVKTQATGQAIFHLSADGATLAYKLIVANINNVFMAHIHFMPDASIILWLYPSPNIVDASGQLSCVAVLGGGNPSACPGYVPGRLNGIIAQGTLTAANLASSDCAGCNGFTFQELVFAIISGTAFVNVHTTQNPAGEIQGPIH